MTPHLFPDRLRLLVNRLRERLWAKPLAMGLLSAWAAISATFADDTDLAQYLPRIAVDSLESLLTIQASTMMVIATFAVASMVSAYASVSTSVTPRAFTLVVADDVSQNALSTFVGAFIFSIVALVATQNGFFGRAGLFTLFVLTLLVFSVVILTFVRWVDRIARLGRMGTTIGAVERATAAAMNRRKRAPHLQGAPVQLQQVQGRPVYADSVGFVQYIDVPALQACAEKAQGRVVVSALPGKFAAPGVVLAYISAPPGATHDFDPAQVAAAFMIGDQRRYDDDPRFGLVVLAQIAGRALSPAVNDPGTAIDVVGTLVRLLVLWATPVDRQDKTRPVNDRVEVPALATRDLLDDAFTAIARDGAASIEIGIRLQKAMHALSSTGDAALCEAASHHAALALERAESALTLPHDLDTLRGVAASNPPALRAP